MSRACLTHLTISQAKAGLLKKDFSAQEFIQAYLNAVEKSAHLNAYITLTPELALRQAQESDQRLRQGEPRFLEGLPLGIKDLFCTKGVQTTAASRILKGFFPPYESTVTQRLWQAGAVMLGKTNLDEFAMGSSNLTSAFGPVVNPWKSLKNPQLNLVPGGSSGGSAAAVAGGIALASLGTDTGGSIRQPAAFCGIVGLKPSYGRCSRWGTIAFASSLDHPGPFARTVEDVAAVLQVIAGHDEKDATSSRVLVPDYAAALAGGNLKDLKIGIPKEYEMPGMDDELIALWERGKTWLREAGAKIISVSLPHTSFSLATYYVLAPAEASSNLARYDGVRFGQREEGDTLDEIYENTRACGFGEEVKRRILIGTYVLSQGHYEAYYLKAQKVRALIVEDFKKAFDQVDLLLTPSAPTGAFGIGQEPKDPTAMYLNDVFTVPVNLAGLPAISVPCSLNAEGLPLGLQLIGRRFDEETVLKGASLLEKAAHFPDLPFIRGV